MMQRTYTQEQMDFLDAVSALVTGKKHTGKKDFIPPHGPGGMITYPGVRPQMYNLTPRVGNFTKKLPLIKNPNAKERREFITGVTAQTGTNPTSTCGTPPKSGNMKVAQIDVEFGEFYKGSDTIKVADAGLRVDRADINRTLLNPSDELSENPFVPIPIGATADSFNTYLGKLYMEFGQGAMLDFAVVDWRGDPTKDNTQTQLGFISEFLGFDGWIKTGYTDVVSGATVPSLDSQVLLYNATLGSGFVENASDQFRALKMQAELSNTPNTIWEIVVHPRAKYSIFDMWACNYATARCLPDATNGRRLDVEAVTDLRDTMYEGNYLLIDGERVSVSTDAGIAATQAEATGIWTSDFYFIPMDDGKGNPLAYHEFLPRDASNKDLSEIIASTGGRFREMNNGFYLMTWEVAKFCITYYFTAKARLILERPDLAGRIDNVSFTSNVKMNDPFPGATYHRNGGTTWRDL